MERSLILTAVSYTHLITNPILFYTNVCGNVEEGYTRDEIDGQLKSELMTALQPAFATVSYTHLDVYKRQAENNRMR